MIWNVYKWNSEWSGYKYCLLSPVDMKNQPTNSPARNTSRVGNSKLTSPILFPTSLNFDSLLLFFRHTYTGQFTCYAETAQFTANELSAALNAARLLPVSERAISEQTGLRIAWETGRPFSPTYAVTTRRAACLLFFILFQLLQFSLPSVFLLYTMGAILLKQKLIKTQDFLSDSPPSNFIPSVALSSSFQLSFS